ncbi:hypothetical protein GCM10027174_39470 [Salinifilum aidingensis]
MNDDERAENEAVRAVIRTLIREAADQTCRANRLLDEVERLLRADAEDGDDSVYSRKVHSDATHSGAERAGAARAEARSGTGQALGTGARTIPKERFTDLTERERQVLSLLLSGKPNRQIARQMGITERTVKNHLRAVFVKLGVSDRTSAVIKILDEGALNGAVPDRGA